MVAALMAHQKDDEDGSALTQAARALDSELKRFERLSESVRKSTLNSQKSLEQAAHALREVADLDESLGAHVRALVAAVAMVRDRQQVQAESIQAAAQHLQKRTEIYQGLLQRYEQLGKDAVGLNALMKQLMSTDGSGQGLSAVDGQAVGLATLEAQIGHVVEGAQALVDLSREQDFQDISRQVDSLRQQLLSARNKVGLLYKRLQA